MLAIYSVGALQADGKHVFPVDFQALELTDWFSLYLLSAQHFFCHRDDGIDGKSARIDL
jgi:hypothetical protein